MKLALGARLNLGAATRNFWVMGGDLAFFSLGLSVSSAYTILPLFVSQLTSENWPVTLIPALRFLGQLLPTVFIGGVVERQRRVKPMIMRLTLLERFPFALLAIAAVVLVDASHTLLLAIFFVLVALQNLGTGLTMPSWLDFVARAIPDRVRGRFFGGWLGVGGLLGIAGAALAGGMLVWLRWPWSFAACFAVSFLMVMVSYFIFALSREPARLEIHAPEPQAGHLLRRAVVWLADLWGLVREDRIFARYLAANILSGLAGLGNGLLAVAALHQAHLSPAVVGFEGTVLLLATTLGNFLWGALGDHAGYRIVMIGTMLASSLSMALAFLARDAVAVTLAFLLLGLSTSGLIVAQLGWVVDFGTPARRPLYIGLAYLVLAPFAAGAPVAGGIMADRWGYGPVFALATLLGLITALVYWRWVIDPRPANGHAAPIAR
jgi:MFS family permease